MLLTVDERPLVLNISQYCVLAACGGKCARGAKQHVVQIGVRADGTPTRWTFTEITPDSFHWLGESLAPDGKTWKLEGEFRARRIRG